MRVAVFSDSGLADEWLRAVYIDVVERLGPRHDPKTIDRPARAVGKRGDAAYRIARDRSGTSLDRSSEDADAGGEQ